ncbi:hypothetical protein PO909_023972 [Leuciscus waleckii]
MATITCRVQYLEDSDPFVCTNFPEPRRPPHYDLNEHLPLNEQIAGVHKLLEAPLKLEECALQLASNGNYLDLDSSLAEQRDDLEQLYEDVEKGKKPILILRTQLSVRVHSILGKSMCTIIRLDERDRLFARSFQRLYVFFAEVASTSSLAFHSGCWFSLSWRRKKLATFSRNAEMILSLFDFPLSWDHSNYILKFFNDTFSEL